MRNFFLGKKRILLLVIGVFSLFVIGKSERGEDDEGKERRYQLGQTVSIQCKNEHGQWGEGPICVQTGKGIQFSFGQDQIQECGLKIDEESYLNYMKRLVETKENWMCRIEMSPEEKPFYVPFVIPMWGVSESDHIHIINHLNFIFHADEGKIVAAAAYPLTENNFQFAKTGSVIQFHGPIKWFRDHSFKDFIFEKEMRKISSNEEIIFGILLYGTVTILLTCFSFFAFYHFVLKPNLFLQLKGNNSHLPHPSIQ